MGEQAWIPGQGQRWQRRESGETHLLSLWEGGTCQEGLQAVTTTITTTMTTTKWCEGCGQDSARTKEERVRRTHRKARLAPRTSSAGIAAKEDIPRRSVGARKALERWTSRSLDKSKLARSLGSSLLLSPGISHQAIRESAHSRCGLRCSSHSRAGQNSAAVPEA
eukprot:2530377-Amphidinium_carterae.1